MSIGSLQAREVFHLTFLRWLTRALPLESFALKGGSNLRFYFGSVRYSEDMDVDVEGVAVHVLAEKVMAVLGSGAFADTLRTHGIESVLPPDLSRAKQTATVQRFKVHLVTRAREDLFTKVEFSRRGLDAPVLAQAVSAELLGSYRMASLIAPHYAAEAAVRQKVRALRGRREPQARDVFDLHLLIPHVEPLAESVLGAFPAKELEDARGRVFDLGFDAFRDQVVAYLGPQDRAFHLNSEVWDEIRLGVVALLERGLEGHG